MVDATRPRPAPPRGPYVVAGMARAGCAAVDALLRHARGASVVGWDSADNPGLRSTQALLGNRGVPVVLGGRVSDLLDRQPAPRTLIKSPGIRLQSPAVAAAVERGVEVIDEAELGWRLDPRPFVSVTGTNGKSTTAAFALAVLRAAGRQPVLAGNTHFGPPLCAASRVPGDVVVAEISSFQLAGSSALLPDAAVFTNLTFEHWGWHGGEAAYREAKAKLFVRGDECVPACAINVDDAFGRTLAEAVTERGGRVVGFGRSPAADYRLVDCRWDLRRAEIRAATPHGEIEAEVPLPGPHNGFNALGAVAVADALGLDPRQAAEAIRDAPPPPGRFEVVDEGQGFDVVVDYGHTVDGVLRSLETARALLEARGGGTLRVVGSMLAFADEDERFAVGRALADHADHLVLTTQRVTPDDPAGLPLGLAEGAKNGQAEVEAVVDRGPAIERAIAAARDGDVVLILGRGAFTGPVADASGNWTEFDDRAQARLALGAVRSTV
jgi:UDP-N-acetylmuramoyl-L-alanyl-D-glutamate--2,6-diaminopimelate ligase